MEQAVDDLNLLRRVARRDEVALRALFGRHQVRVFRFVMRLIRNDAIAEELTNEVFMEVWRNAGKFEGRSSVSTWLLSIAHNRSVSTLRKKRDENWDEDSALEIADDNDDPEVAAQKSDKGKLLRHCIDQLSAEHREIIDLAYYHEKSVAEISEIVGAPQATVKTRMFYGRKKLSEILKDAGVDRGWP
jgi:RNA polymerase sigma-70 factor (ECF subfamily)